MSLRGGLAAISVATLGALGILPAPAATFIWSGNGGNNNWSTPANWTGNISPPNDGTATILFAGTTNLNPIADLAWDINSLTFSNNAGAFILSGNNLTIRAGGIVSSNANLQTINNAILLAAAQSWNAASGPLAFNGTINNITNLLTISGAFNSTINGSLSGTGGLTKTGTGTNTLTTTNSYSGVTTVSAGILNIQNPAALGSTNGGTVVSSGASLQLQGGISVIGEPLALSGSGISSSGALRSIAGNNNWSGVITLNAASTVGCDAGNFTIGSGTILNSTFLTTFTNAGNISVTAVIGSGTGGLTKTGPGTLALSGTNTYAGTTTVSAGVLNIQNAAALGSTAAGTAVSSGATLQLQGGFDIAGETLSLSGIGVSNLGALQNLNGSNSWSGTITLAGSSTIGAEAGTLYLSAPIANSTLTTTFTNTGVIVLAGAIGSGSGAFIKNGVGTVILTASHTYTGHNHHQWWHRPVRARRSSPLHICCHGECCGNIGSERI